MSGTNRTVMSDVIVKGKGESALTKALDNANVEAVKLDPKDIKKAKNK